MNPKVQTKTEPTLSLKKAATFPENGQEKHSITTLIFLFETVTVLRHCTIVPMSYFIYDSWLSTFLNKIIMITEININVEIEQSSSLSANNNSESESSVFWQILINYIPFYLKCISN